MSKKTSTPPAPDYTAAAKATAEGNLDAVRAQTAANRVSQYTPQGSLTYDITGEDKYGNPIWSAYQAYSPEEQSIYESNTRLSQGLLDTAESGLGYVDDLLANPTIDESKLPSVRLNPGEAYTDAAMRFMQPTQDRQREALRTQLVNQGFGMDSEGYQNAMSDMQDQFDRANLQAVMGGMDKDYTARQNAMQEQSYFQDRPLNIINALRTGNQVQGPQFVNPSQQAFAPGPDYTGAANAQYNAALQASNAQNAANSNFMGGLFGLGGAVLGNPTFKFPW